MTDWIEHNGGPQPVGDNVWVETIQRHGLGEGPALAGALDWRHMDRSRDFVAFCILNQHLIDAARLEGIRLGLEAALKEAVIWVSFIQGDRIESAVRALNPETIARDCLTKPAPSDLLPSSSDTIAQEAHND